MRLIQKADIDNPETTYGEDIIKTARTPLGTTVEIIAGTELFTKAQAESESTKWTKRLEDITKLEVKP